MADKSQSITSELLRQKSWVYALLVVVGIGLGAIGVSSYQSAAEFSTNGAKVIGEITLLHDYGGVSDRSVKRSKTFNVSYTFATADDPHNNGSQLVSERFYENLSDGGPISVWYLAVDPKQNVVDLDKLTNGLWLTMMSAMGLILTGIVGGGLAIQRARANVRSNRDRDS